MMMMAKYSEILLPESGSTCPSVLKMYFISFVLMGLSVSNRR